MLLQAGLIGIYHGNLAQFARAIGAHRQTVYQWMTQKRPQIANERHRAGIAQACSVELKTVDAAIVRGLGYHPIPTLRPEVLAAAMIMNELHAEDIARLEREALMMRRRDAQIRADPASTPPAAKPPRLARKDRPSK